MSNATDSETTTLEWSVIEARGDDAESFLQGQLSQDLASLDERGAWTLVLAPDSVVVTAALAISREEGIDLVVPRELAEATARAAAAISPSHQVHARRARRRRGSLRHARRADRRALARRQRVRALAHAALVRASLR